MIDLHLHTTASDGMLTPAALVARAAPAGISVLSVTDHDTVAGLDEARQAAEARGLTFVNGIEITAVHEGRDVHMLGYFFDAGSAPFNAFLATQRADRVRRVRAIAERLGRLGCPIDVEPLLAAVAGHPGTSVGRPRIAQALVDAGHVRDSDEAFDRWLGNDRPAFVPRQGTSPEQVIALIRAAGGVSSLAHPGLLRQDALIPRLAAAGLAALEVRHSDHDEAAERHYRRMAAELGLAVSGGSDFHGDTGHRTATLGSVGIEVRDFEGLRARIP